MKRIHNLFLILAALFIAVPVQTTGESREELLEKLKKIREEKAKLHQQSATSTDAQSARGVRESIARYEKTMSGCVNPTGFQKNLCADAAYSLARLYYKKARNDYVNAQNQYEEKFAKWDKNPMGPRPVAPVPDYSKALETYKEAVQKYPASNKLANAYYQIGGIYDLQGDIDSAKAAFMQIVKQRPSSKLVPTAHFRIAQILYTQHQQREALTHLEKMDMSKVSPINHEMAHYRKSEIYYNIGDLDKSAKLFGEYVDNCDRGVFPRGDLRSEAIEYLAITFSDMPKGAERAISYFQEKGGRSYEDTVIYNVGFKNFDHGQYEQSIVALETAIQKYPNFERAPEAQMKIVNSHVINKKYAKANAAREKLVSDYSRNSSWIRNNQGNRIALAKAENQVKEAISSIAVYYHTEAQEDTTDAGKPTEEGRENYRKALAMYNRFIEDYPEEQWKNYKFHYYAGEAYSTLNQYRKAADYYDHVAQADLSAFPEYSPELGDTVGMSREMVEELRKEQQKSVNDISQEEAGYNAIANLSELRKKETEAQGLDDKASYQLASTREFLNYIHSYQKRFPQAEMAPKVLLLAADVEFDGEDYTAAIQDCKTIISTYDAEDVIWEARKLMADAYAANEDFDRAVENYDMLVAQGKKRETMIELASGTVFNKGKYLAEQGNHVAATKVFRSVKDKYPESPYEVQAWFEAGISFEEVEMYDSAAAVFEQLPSLFADAAEKDMKKNAYGRAARNYGKIKDYTGAALVSYEGAQNIGDTAYAVAFYSTAADYYDTAQAPEKGGDMMYQIYKRFPQHEKAPDALYRAGDFYENKAENYSKAIEVYSVLSDKFPEDKLGLEGAFSIGYCYKAMDEKENMAEAFADFAKRFSRDRPKQIKALVFATRAYMDMDQFDKAELNVSLATKIYDEYKDEAAIAPHLGAEAYYTKGSLNHNKILKIDLSKGSREKVIEEKVDKVKDLIEPTLESYQLAAGQMVREWTVKALFQLAKLNYDYARMYEEKKVFGNAEDKIVNKAKALKGVCPVIYDRASENLVRLIQKSQEENIDNEYIDKAKRLYVETGYRKAQLLKKIGILYRDAPMPDGLSGQEQQVYMDELYNQFLQYYAQSMPYYEQTLKGAIDLHIANNKWVDSIKKEIEMVEIETMNEVTSEYKTVDLDKKLEEYKNSAEAKEARLAAIKKKTDDELQKSLDQINRIYNSEIPIEEKITELLEIEADARRVIEEEEAKIREYRKILGIDVSGNSNGNTTN
ncbi:MAG: tetratricopeptide repeat protein [Fibrobacterota bacterium]